MNGICSTTRFFALLFMSLTLVSCTTTSKKDNSNKNQEHAIVLIGIGGLGGVDYIQLCSSELFSFCINHRKEPIYDVAAISVPVPQKGLELSSFSLAYSPRGFIGHFSFGYINVKDSPIDIDKPGIYYLLTLDTDNPGEFTSEPTAEILKLARSTHSFDIGSLEPVNFVWPE